MTYLSKSNLEKLFKGAIRYDDRSFPFADAFSQFSVGFRAGRALGLGFLHPRAMLSTYEVTEPALEMWVGEGGQWLPMTRQSLVSWPWMAQEDGSIACSDGVLNVQATHVFQDERALKSRFEVTLDSELAPKLNIAFVGAVQGDVKHYMTPYFDGPRPSARESFVEKNASQNALICGLSPIVEKGALPWAAFRIGCVKGNLQPWIGSHPFWLESLWNDSPQRLAAQKQNLSYALGTKSPFTIYPGETLVFEFETQFSAGMAPMPANVFWPHIEKANQSDLITAAKDRFFEALNPATLPQTNSSALDFGVARARLGLLRDGIRGLDGEFGPHIASLCTADTSDFSCSFFWDSLFSSVALSAFHSDAARGAIATAFTRQSEIDGSTPERKWNYGVDARMFQQAPQSPVAAWAVTELQNRHQDDEFLSFIYPKLLRNHRFWEKFSDVDEDGLAEYRWSGQIADNSPLWDCYVSTPDKTTGCGWLPPVASVALNCFLYKDATHLEQLARQMGRTAEAEDFALRRRQIYERLMATCYLAEENRFWDFNQLTRTHRRIKTFYMFWPLYARLPIPEKQARDLIENVLLDPKQFFGAVPFPSVAYDEPTYDPNGYWRGRAWPHISYWLLETLAAYGYSNEANEAATRILTWYGANGIRENLSTDASEVHPHGFLDYNWGCAAFELIASRHYLRAPRFHSG